MYVILFSENGGSFSYVETELPAPEDTQGGAQVWVDIFNGFKAKHVGALFTYSRR